MPDMSTMSSETSGTRVEQKSGGKISEQFHLREELSEIKSDLDALMSHASTLTEQELREARDRIMARFSSLRYSAKGFANQASKQLNEGMDASLSFVRKRPVQSVLIATGIGLAIGALLKRS